MTCQKRSLCLQLCSRYRLPLSAVTAHTAETEGTNAPSASTTDGGTGGTTSYGVGVGRLALGRPVVARVPLVAYRADSDDQINAGVDLSSGVYPVVEASLAYLPTRAQSLGEEASGGDD